MNMKKLEKFVILLIILWLLQRPVGYLASMIYVRTLSIEQLGQLSLRLVFSSYALTFFKQLVNILIGIWLFITAKKEKEGTPWFWLMLGLFTGVIGALLYFILRIYQTIQSKKELTVKNIKYPASSMRKIERFAIIIFILWILYVLFSPSLKTIYHYLFSKDDLLEALKSTTDNIWLSYSYLIVKQIASILIGIWLFVTVKREKQGSPWFWLMLSIFSGVFAPLLYFILRVYQTIKPESMVATEYTGLSSRPPSRDPER